MKHPLLIACAAILGISLHAQNPTIIDTFPNGLIGKKINFYYFETDPVATTATQELSR